MSRAAAALGRAGAALALLAGLACGGGGGGSPSEPPPPTATPPPPGVSLVVTTPQGAAITVARGARSTAALLVLEVRAESVAGLYGAAFDLLYPDALFDYQARVAGPFLGADDVSAQVFESATGNLVVGITRVGNLPGVDGSGVLLELELAVRAAGSGEISFARRSAHAADGIELPVGWGSATVTVRQ